MKRQFEWITGGTPGEIVINGGTVTAIGEHGTAIGLGSNSTCTGNVKILKEASVIAVKDNVTSKPVISTPNGSLKSGSDANILMAGFDWYIYGSKIEVRDSNGVPLNPAIEYRIPTSANVMYTDVAFSLPNTGTYTLYKDGIKQEGTKNSATRASFTVEAGLNEWTEVSTAVTYPVTWKSQDGVTTLEEDRDISYGSAPSFDAAEPTKEADAQYTYTFAGWSMTPNAESGTEAGSLPAVSGAVTYYAAFSKTLRTYNVAWKSQDGVVTLETDSDISYGSAPSFDAAF